MATQLGIRERDLGPFQDVAQKYQVILLVRHTNRDSLTYVGQEGYQPKPLVVKAKTADCNPPFRREISVAYEVSGLVVHPELQPDVFGAAKRAKAKQHWNDTIAFLTPHMAGKPAHPENPDTWAEWRLERASTYAWGWKWRVDVDPHSKHFGALQMRVADRPWHYLHGDYDLKDIVALEAQSSNETREGRRDGQDNTTAVLPGRHWLEIRNDLNNRIGLEMVQHGADAQFRDHDEEPITVFYSDGQKEVLENETQVRRWYDAREREVPQA